MMKDKRVRAIFNFKEFGELLLVLGKSSGATISSAGPSNIDDSFSLAMSLASGNKGSLAFSP